MAEQTRSVRVWTNLNVAEVRKHLLLVDDLYGVCSNCKQTGLNYTKDKTCPGCQTTFRYMATRISNSANVGKMLARIQKDKLQLTLIDREDFEKSSARSDINNLFG